MLARTLLLYLGDGLGTLGIALRIDHAFPVAGEEVKEYLSHVFIARDDRTEALWRASVPHKGVHEVLAKFDVDKMDAPGELDVRCP